MPTLTDLMRGSIGYFWIDLRNLGSSDGALPGHVHLTDDGELILDLLSRDHIFRPRPNGLPHSVGATTAAGGALFLDIRGAHYAATKGGFQASTRRYRSGAVVFDVPLDSLNGDNFLDVTAFFPGIGQWAALAGSEDSSTTDQGGRLTSWTVNVRAADEQRTDLGAGTALTLTTHWQVDGPEDRRTIYAPVAFTVSSKRPLSWTKLVPPLLAVQGLLSLAFDGLVLADGGLATLDLHNDAVPLSPSKWWTARLMERPPGARAPRSMNEIPSFNLNTISGIAGVRRWIALTREHPRATGPLVSRHRFGTVNAETRLLDIAAAIEYWVAAHRRHRKWAQKRPGAEHPAAALALFIGEAFAKLVGDPMQWASRFWDTNNLLKHIPNGRYDGYEVHLLAEAGALLLECALLNRAANSRLPAEVICQSHRHYELGRQVRDLLGT